MLKVQENKASITCFVHQHPEVQYIIPIDEEWSICETMERVLEPFYDFTCSISKDKPCLPETIGIMWGLDDLLDDVKKADGQFGDVGDDIRAAFSAGIEQVEEHTSLISDNVMYYAVAILDPRIKCNLIKEQYGDEATNAS